MNFGNQLPELYGIQIIVDEISEVAPNLFISYENIYFHLFHIQICN